MREIVLLALSGVSQSGSAVDRARHPRRRSRDDLRRFYQAYSELAPAFERSTATASLRRAARRSGFPGSDSQPSQAGPSPPMW